MRKIPGMSGDEEEHPASNRAGSMVSGCCEISERRALTE